LPSFPLKKEENHPRELEKEEEESAFTKGKDRTPTRKD